MWKEITCRNKITDEKKLVEKKKLILYFKNFFKHLIKKVQYLNAKQLSMKKCTYVEILCQNFDTQHLKFNKIKGKDSEKRSFLKYFLQIRLLIILFKKKF